MGAGCSSTSTALETHKGAQRLLGAFNAMGATPPLAQQTTPQPTSQGTPPLSNDSPPSTNQPPQPDNKDIPPPTNPETQPGRPLMKPRQSMHAPIREQSKDDFNLPTRTLSALLNSNNEDGFNNNKPHPTTAQSMESNNNSNGFVGASPDSSRRRSNSISILPSIELKPKIPNHSINRGEGKKNDPDLALWISNKLKTKLKLTRLTKAYDRYVKT